MSLIDEYDFKKCVDRYIGDRHAIKTISRTQSDRCSSEELTSVNFIINRRSLSKAVGVVAAQSKKGGDKNLR